MMVITEGLAQEIEADVTALREKYKDTLILKVLVLDKNAPYNVMEIIQELLKWIAEPIR